MKKIVGEILLLIIVSIFMVSCSGTSTSNNVQQGKSPEEQKKVAVKAQNDVKEENKEIKANSESDVAVQKAEVTRSENAAPDFEFKDLMTGKTYKLSDFTGKVVIIDFWATWCPPCKMEIPHFVELYNKYKDQGLEIIGVSFDQAPSTVKEFAEQNGIKYYLTMGTRELAMRYGGIDGIPTTFFIRKNGEIANIEEIGDNKVVGYRPKEFFEKIIKKLLKE